jgi:hypothetical protein
MTRPAVVFPIALALGAVILAPTAGAREEGPIEIEKCQTISQPGSYKLVNNLTFTGNIGTCLDITASFVTIDLAGFTMTGGGVTTTAIVATPSSGQLRGIAVRNGSISGFGVGVDLLGGGVVDSVVEGLRVFGGVPGGLGIGANGIVRGNTVAVFGGVPGNVGTGISATGIVTGNFARGNGGGMGIGQGSTLIGNSVLDSRFVGISVDCPANLTDNTALNNGVNLVLNGDGCHTEDNVAP